MDVHYFAAKENRLCAVYFAAVLQDPRTQIEGALGIHNYKTDVCSFTRLEGPPSIWEKDKITLYFQPHGPMTKTPTFVRYQNGEKQAVVCIASALDKPDARLEELILTNVIDEHLSRRGLLPVSSSRHQAEHTLKLLLEDCCVNA